MHAFLNHSNPQANNIMKPSYLSTVAVLALLAGGCASLPSVGPNYHQPNATVPTGWSMLAGGETNSAPVVAVWWENFHDAELDSLITRAASANLDLRIDQARVREARAEYRIAAADQWPTVDAAGSYARQQQSQNQPVLGSFPVPGSAFQNNVYQAGFDATWEIDVFGGTRRATEAARAQVAAAQCGEREVLVTLLGEVARNYVETRGYQRRLEIARDNIRAQVDSLAITQNRFTNGLTSDLDVEQASTLLATTRAEVPALETALAASIHRLGVLLGQTPESLETELAAVAPSPAAPPVVPVGLPAELLWRRPDVAQAERQLAAATANIGVAKADLFPKFYLTGAAGLESISADDWFKSGSQFWSVGPAVQWRIFDAGRIRANIRVRNARQEQALANYENTALGAFEEGENALTAYATEQIRRQQLAAAVTSSAESLRLAKQLYTSGLANFINVLDAERSLYQAQDALVQSDRTVTTDVIALYKSLGGGWETVTQPETLAAVQTTK